MSTKNHMKALAAVFFVAIATLGTYSMDMALWISSHLTPNKANLYSLETIPVTHNFSHDTITIQSARYDSKETSPITYGEIKNPDRAYIRLNLRFRAESMEGYPNLFQTAPLNRGIRLEISGSTAALIIPDLSLPNGLRGLLLTTSLKAGRWYTLDVEVLNHAFVHASLDGQPVVNYVDTNLSIKTSHIMVGSGFDASRTFRGQIENIIVTKGNLSSPIKFGGVKNSDNAYIRLKLRFRAESIGGYHNLFQTAPLNRGMRLEISGSTAALIIPDLTLPNGLRGLLLTTSLKAGQWYTLDVEVLNQAFVHASLDGQPVVNYVDTNLSIKTSHILVGSGFDASRTFRGQIENIFVTKGNFYSPIAFDGVQNPENAYVRLKLRFRVEGTEGYPNLFQTAPLNRGMRLEISGSTAALIIPDLSLPNGLRGLYLTTSLKAGQWYTLDTEVLNHAFIHASLNELPVVNYENNNLTIETSQILVGGGFYASPAFRGQIENISITKGNLDTANILVVYAIIAILITLFFFTLWTILDKRKRRSRIIYVGALMMLTIAALSAWLFMPIYPDEIAFRLLSGRYIQDQGLAQKLFYICPSNARETPFLFILPAWILSWLDLHFSLVEARILPFITVLAAIFLSIVVALKGQNRAAAIVATTALIGVAGSSLVFARMEYLQVLNIAICVLAYIQLNTSTIRTSVRYGLSTLLLFSSLLSIYSHVQGLLFLPLTLYFVYRLVSSNLGKIKSALILTGILLFVATTTVNFKVFSCVEYPGILNYVSNLTLSLRNFESINLIDWLASNINIYLQPFYYNDSYQVNFLPGITVDEGWLQNILEALNQNIHFILLANLAIFVCAAIAASIFAAKKHIQMFQLRATGGVAAKGLEDAHAIMLFTLPIVFLFFFDAAHNFYRSFFINLLVSLLLAILLSRLPLGRLRTIAITYFVLCAAIVVTSLVINVWWFSDKLIDGFEGPGISINKDWDGIDSDVKSLALESGMDLSKGKIIVDDMTYDSLKSYPFLYPITYLNLSGDLSKLSSAEVINLIRPNYAIVRCDYLRTWGITPQKIRNQFCAVNFLSTE